MPTRPSRDDLRRAVEHAARVKIEFTRAVAEQRAALVRRTPAEHMQRDLRAFDRNARQAAQELDAALTQALDAAEQHMVLPFPPSRRPQGAAEAAWISALASVAGSFTPAILASEIEAAAHHEDRATLAILLPLAMSKSSYDKAFIGDTALTKAVRVGQAAIVTPEEKASAEDAEWVRHSRRESGDLRAVDRARDPVKTLDEYLRDGVFKHLVPGWTPPTFDVDGKEPPPRVLPELGDAVPIGAPTGSTGGSEQP